MNNLPRQTLGRIVGKYGRDIISDPRRCESLLNDLCGAHRREINVLINAVDERVPLDLLSGASSLPMELLLNRLEKRLAEQTALTAEAARWAVESWALALALVTENDIEKRHHQEVFAAPPESKAKSPQPDVDGEVNSIVNRRPPAEPPAVLAPQINLPINRPAPMPAPPVRFPANNQSPSPTSVQPTQAPANQPPVVKKRFGVLRGCLLVLSLLAIASIVLLFGVPYAIEKMRETQAERNREPPRFPAP